MRGTRSSGSTAPCQAAMTPTCRSSRSANTGFARATT
jgi:hypothetical protein